MVYYTDYRITLRNFDADAAIATGELIQLIPDLLEALGGEQVMGLTTSRRIGRENNVLVLA